MADGSRQVFISYARSDAARVDTLVEGLRQLRYDVWLDEELTGGQAWWDTVLSQIRASSAVLVTLSPAALESVAVRREYEYGHAVGRPLLPVVVQAVRLETLPPLLAPLQVVDYHEPGTKSAFALAAALAALPVPQPLPQPLPEPPPIPVSYLSGLMERSQAATLSMDEQLALVARLKVALGRASEREAAEEVLRALRNRDDLYQVSAREIEPLLSAIDRQVPKSEVSYKGSDMAEHIIYNSTESADVGFDFEGKEGQIWTGEGADLRPISKKGRGKLSFQEGGIINIYRTNNDGKYEVRLRRYSYGDRNDNEILPRSRTISRKRHLRVSCEAKITESEHKLRFVLKSDPTGKWLDNQSIVISEKVWVPFKLYLAIDPTVDCFLRIDDYDVGSIPSNLQIRKIVVTEQK